MIEKLSQENFAAIIHQNTGLINGTVDTVAMLIWQLVASHIEETENRIIDAEFAKTEVEKLLAELVEHFHVDEKPDWMPRSAYDTLQLAHGSGEHRYWFSVAGNSMDEAALGHLGDILRRARLTLGLEPGPELYPQAQLVTMVERKPE